MNKRDYIEQGRQAFSNGLSLPVECARAESWQQKAIAEGWNAARKESQTIAGEIEPGVTSQDVAQRQRVLSVLGRDMEWSRAREMDNLASNARFLAAAIIPQCDGDHARRSHVTDLLIRASSFGVSTRGERLLRKALDVAYRLVESRA